VIGTVYSSRVDNQPRQTFTILCWASVFHGFRGVKLIPRAIVDGTKVDSRVRAYVLKEFL